MTRKANINRTGRLQALVLLVTIAASMVAQTDPAAAEEPNTIC